MTKNIGKGTPVVHVSAGGRSLDREAITVGHQDIPVRFYRTSDPTIFAGFQINWIDGRDETTGAEINLSSGAGFGSKYMTLSISMPGHPTVYEYVDISEVLKDRAMTILAEIADEGVCEDPAATQARCKDSDDPDLQEQAKDMDACPNNPRNGGPGLYGKNKHLDRR